VLHCRESLATACRVVVTPDVLEVHYEEPVEKLWRWVRQDILKMHRWVEDWPQVKQRLHEFLDQFAHGSPDLLRYVGLVGKGKLATVINTS
jgi:hypothetical protein